MTCDKCRQPITPGENFTRAEGWEDGGQRGYDELELCRACAKSFDERVAYEEFLSDPYSAAYERLRAQGWAD